MFRGLSKLYTGLDWLACFITGISTNNFSKVTNLELCDVGYSKSDINRYDFVRRYKLNGTLVNSGNTTSVQFPLHELRGPSNIGALRLLICLSRMTKTLN